MKRNIQKIAAAAFTMWVFCVLSAQGFKLSQPDEVGGNFSATHLDGLVSSSSCGPGLEAFIRYRVSQNFMVSAGTGFYTAMDKTLSWDNYKTTLFPNLEITGFVMPSGERRVVPMAFAGLHLFGWKWTAKSSGHTFSSDKTYYDANLVLGAGLQLIANEKISYQVSGDYRYAFTMDAGARSKFWTAKVGLSYALSKSKRTPTYRKNEEIEYPMGEQELSTLDDLFKEDTGKKGGSDEDALSLLFQPESGKSATGTKSKSGSESEDQDLSSLFGTEESASSATEETTGSNYPDTEIGQLMAQVDRLKSEVDQKSQVVDQLQNKVQALEEERSGGLTAGGPPLSEGEFKSKYASALDKFHMRQYREAIADFQALAASNPKHMLASNCHYWTGECYNALGNYQKAVQEFQTVLNYSRSYKLAPALIMSGLCYIKMGDSNMARTRFQELIDRYPDSEYAPKAMRYLGSL
jgi:tol-pal system protein YbgF